MSVYKSKQGNGKLRVQTKAYDLASHTHHICSNERVFLKRNRWCSTAKIVGVVDEIAINIDIANSMRIENPKRKDYQNLAIVKSIELEALMEIAYRDNNRDKKSLDDDKFNHWIGLVLELRGLLIAWRDSPQR